MLDSADNRLPEELLKSLSAVTIMIQNVLSDIKEHSTSLAILRTKLEDLTNNVNELAHVVRDGNGKGSMMTRVALAEKALEDIEEQINDLKEQIERKPHVSEEDERKYKRDKSVARWQALGAMAAAFVAMALQLFQVFYK